MSGRTPAGAGAEPPEKHDHVVLTLDDGTVVRFNDTRRFGTLARKIKPDEMNIPILNKR